MGLFSKSQPKRQAYQIACADVGVDCAGLFRSHDRNEVIKAATAHAKNQHGVTIKEADNAGNVKVVTSW
ncbi:MAG: DUF1059 domain-containing protein [Candidatus Thermoplasmatota archaeon]